MAVTTIANLGFFFVSPDAIKAPYLLAASSAPSITSFTNLKLTFSGKSKAILTAIGKPPETSMSLTACDMAKSPTHLALLNPKLYARFSPLLSVFKSNTSSSHIFISKKALS